MSERHVAVAVSEAVETVATAAAAAAAVVVVDVPVLSFHVGAVCGSCSCHRRHLMGTAGIVLAETDCGPAESKTGCGLAAGGQVMQSIGSSAGCSVGDR